jgi:hypothetical protein
MAAAVLALSTVAMGSVAHAIIAAVLTILAALGFAPGPVPIPAVLKKAPARHRIGT